jgi:hypothetical protein
VIWLGFLLTFVVGMVAGALGLLYVLATVPRRLGAIFNANPKG